MPPRLRMPTFIHVNVRASRSVWIYFALTMAFGAPFWLLGALSGAQILPALPIAAFGVVCMVGAAAVMTFREKGSKGVIALLKRTIDLGRAKDTAWYVPAVLLMPLIMALSFGLMRLAGTPVPVPRITALKTLALFAVFLVGAACEELGWSGYAADPLIDRYGALNAALIIGAVWAAWHFIPLAEAHRSLSFILWWTLGTMALRVIIVWLYTNTGGSVFIAALFHAMVNLTWQLFPVDGSFYDPRVTSPLLALAAVLIAALWGPKTLTREG